MDKFIEKAKIVFNDKILRKKILFVLGAFIIFRAFASVPIPGIDIANLERFFSQNQFLGLLNMFSGGGLSNLSLVMLGVGPYITGSIIMQLLTIMFPKLKAMYHEEGEAGKKKFTQYSRLLTFPLALMQGYAFLTLLQKQNVIGQLGTFDIVSNILIIAAGSVFLMWIGELMTEFGIGNGVSLLIFAGIVAGLPSKMSQLLYTFDVSQVPMYLGFIIVGALVILGVVVVTEAERPIPVTYAKRIRGSKIYGGISTYIPLRINQAGVMPIIFALSILLFPQMIFSFLTSVQNATVVAVSNFVMKILTNQLFYGILYFILVFLFTYFYTAITFDPDAMATNLQKSGAFVPGIRPGKTTSEYIAKIITRITFVGALFLGAVAVLPIMMQSITGIKTLTIGGTALLIVVSVVIDLVKKVDAQVAMREY